MGDGGFDKRSTDEVSAHKCVVCSGLTDKQAKELKESAERSKFSG